MSLKGKEALHMYQIGIDIGGTNVKIGLLDEALELTAETSVPFPHTTAADLAKKIRAARSLRCWKRRTRRFATSARSARSSPAASTQKRRDACSTRTIWASTMCPCGSACCRRQFPGIPVYLCERRKRRARWPSSTRARFAGCKTARSAHARHGAWRRHHSRAATCSTAA